MKLAVVRPPDVGRPIVHTEPWAKVTVVLDEHHVVYLDLVSLLMRVRHRRAVPRAELIRAFVEFMAQSGIDFTRFATTDEMVEYLTAYFRRIANPGRMPLLESGLFPSTTQAARRGRGGRQIDVSPMT